MSHPWDRDRRVIVGAALVLFALTGACTPPSAPTVEGRPEPTPSEASLTKRTPNVVDERGDLIVYMKSTRMQARALDSGELVFDVGLPSPDAVLSPDGASYAVVEDLAPGSDPEGYGQPQIRIGATGGPPRRVLGPGRSPMWSPDGAHVAAITDDSIVAYDIATGEPQEVLDGTDWSLVGWSEERVAAIGPEGVVLAGARDKPERLDIPPAALWGLSPAGPALLSVGGDQPVFVTDGDQIADVAIEGVLGEGTWAPNGRTVAAIELQPQGTQLILIEAASGDTRAVVAGRGAQGSVVWAHDSKMFAFARIDPNDRVRLQAVSCTVGAGCTPLFSWPEGVRLLGFSQD